MKNKKTSGDTHSPKPVNHTDSSDENKPAEQLRAKSESGALEGGRAIWDNVKAALAMELPPTDFGKWIDNLTFLAEVDGEIQLLAQTMTQRDRVRQVFLAQIGDQWRRLDVKNRTVRVVCWAELTSEQQLIMSQEGSSTDEEIDDLYERQTFDTLVQGESNRVATSICKALAAGESVPSNMVFIFGTYGTGKTHILRAIKFASEARRPDRNVVYMSAEEFMCAYTQGVRNNDTHELKMVVRNARLLLIDDLQSITGKKGTQKEFFDNIRAISAKGGQVVITGDEAPSRMMSLSHRVREELQGGTLIEIERPDEAMREAIVRMKVRLLQEKNPDFDLSDEIIAMICSRVRGTGRQLNGAVTSIYTVATYMKQSMVTLEEAEAAIRRQLGEERAPTIEEIKRATTTVFKVSKADLEGKRRHRHIARPRQMAMHLARAMTDKSLPQIGRSFGGRDHTTVMYADRKVDELLKTEEGFRDELERLEQAVEELIYKDK